ncbi:MAG: hypothetical protein K9W44_14895 [Candidatus Lokiarchaeota archaeon]|uniref:HrAgo1 n=1 Tax=Candidatus Harpocratesius repetitus TaxID=3049170 RepID=A0AAT8XUE3_9ARCH|nr:hypothetical protein [Candidatus Harpocratesius repetitus]
MSKSQNKGRKSNDAPLASPCCPQKKKIDLEMNLFPVKISNLKISIYSWLIFPKIDNYKVQRNILEIALSEEALYEYIIQKNKIYQKKRHPNIKRVVLFQNKEFQIEINHLETVYLLDNPTLQNEIFGSICQTVGFEQIGHNYYYSAERQSSQLTQSTKESLKRIFPAIEIDGGKYYLKQGLTTAIHSTKKNFSIDQGKNAISNVVELEQTSKLIQKKNLLEIIMDLNRKVKDHHKIENLLIGSRFITHYNNRIYTIHGIAWNKDPTSTFQIRSKLHQNLEITFEEYYKKNYQLKISDLHQPLIIYYPMSSQKSATSSGSQDILYFLPEFCHLFGLSNLDADNFRIRQEITRNTQMSPSDRYRKLKTFVENQDILEFFKVWGLDIDSRMISMSGIKLPSLEIQTQTGVFPINFEQSNWLSLLNRSQVIDAPELKKWMILYPKKSMSLQEARKFSNDFQKIAQQMGMVCRPPQLQGVFDMTKFLAILKKNPSQHHINSIQLILTITPNRNKTCYRKIKQLCYRDLGIANQNVVLKNLRDQKRRMPIIRNLVRQIICKVPNFNTKYGGALWKIKNNSIPDKTLIVGIDVWHGRPGIDKSIAGIVFSTDKGLHYTANYTITPRKGLEFIHNLGKIIITQLQNHYNATRQYFENILIFRDGVGNTQYNKILQEEFKSIQQELTNSSIFSEKHPKIAIILVNKRINRRLFHKNKQGQILNPKPGTFIEDQYIKSEFSNYYLVPHFSRFGTTRPIHISVIYNNTKYVNFQFVEIANILCHLNYNWAGTVRIPASVEYAHKVADFIGSNQITSIAPELLQTQFYL